MAKVVRIPSDRSSVRFTASQAEVDGLKEVFEQFGDGELITTLGSLGGATFDCGLDLPEFVLRAAVADVQETGMPPAGDRLPQPRLEVTFAQFVLIVMRFQMRQEWGEQFGKALGIPVSELSALVSYWNVVSELSPGELLDSDDESKASMAKVNEKRCHHFWHGFVPQDVLKDLVEDTVSTLPVFFVNMLRARLSIRNCGHKHVKPDVMNALERALAREAGDTKRMLHVALRSVGRSVDDDAISCAACEVDALLQDGAEATEAVVRVSVANRWLPLDVSPNFWCCAVAPEDWAVVFEAVHRVQAQELLSKAGALRVLKLLGLGSSSEICKDLFLRKQKTEQFFLDDAKATDPEDTPGRQRLTMMSTGDRLEAESQLSAGSVKVRVPALAVVGRALVSLNREAPLRPGTPAVLAKEAGFNAQALFAAGYAPFTIKDAGFSCKSMKDAGVTLFDLRSSGWSAAQLRRSGAGAYELKLSGCSLAELRVAGFSGDVLQKLCQHLESKADPYRQELGVVNGRRWWGTPRLRQVDSSVSRPNTCEPRRRTVSTNPSRPRSAPSKGAVAMPKDDSIP